MTTGEKIVIVSAFKKNGLSDLLGELTDHDYDLFATSGTASTYERKTGKKIGSLADLVDEAVAEDANAREMTAQLISGKMAMGELSVKLACLNLRPPKMKGAFLPISVDEGGIAMITTAGGSGALVVTNPHRYDDVLEQLTRKEGVEQRFKQQLQREAHEHIIDHLVLANNLTK